MQIEKRMVLFESGMDGYAIAKHTKPMTRLLLNSDPFSQNGHDFIRASGGDGFAPVVGLGIVFVV